ncbi:MAG: sulfatase-like hydrolase/transferase, partial [Lachnospiraceae bacterium]|nr:sulfatase-like hydrolase/transferase [Lachnospiraceae bacterium]
SEYSGDLGDFQPEISIRGFDGDSLIERYLSLEKATDDAFRGLISYFGSIEDPTVVVFFGDHQPNDYVVEPIWNINNKNGKSLTDVERRMRYTVPYLIWANYDINGRSDLDISANYLGNLVLDAAGIELNGYRDFLKEKMKSYPVISAVEEKSSDGTSKDMDKDDPDLSDYRRVQYYEMFDK